MTSTVPVFEMAETLVALTGDNAWAAARAFGSSFAKEGKPDQARHWRNVARAVLRKLNDATAGPHELTIKPEFVAESLAVPVGAVLALPAPAAPVSVPAMFIAPDEISAAPIPLRARRQLAMLAKAQAMARAETDAPEFAKAA